MSDQIKVHTDKVRLANASIAQLNNHLKSDFTPAKEEVQTLVANWEGAASENAKNVFYAIEEVCLNSRYQEIDQYVSFLSYYVEGGYTQAESANTSIARANFLDNREMQRKIIGAFEAVNSTIPRGE